MPDGEQYAALTRDRPSRRVMRLDSTRMSKAGGWMMLDILLKSAENQVGNLKLRRCRRCQRQTQHLFCSVHKSTDSHHFEWQCTACPVTKTARREVMRHIAS
jgi:hypothetical protein